jgi:hypothetical protein
MSNIRELVISYSYKKHSNDDYEQNIINAMKSIGLDYDGSDTSLNKDMIRKLYFYYSHDSRDIKFTTR